MRTYRAGRRDEPGRLLRAWRWLRSSGSYSGVEEDPGSPSSPDDPQAKVLLTRIALTHQAISAGRW